MNKKRLNEEFISLSGQLATIMLKQGEPFKARSYQKAQETIINFEGDILGVDQLKGLPNIGSTITEKLNEYVKTGTLKILGSKKAEELVKVNKESDIDDLIKLFKKMGITLLEQLNEKQLIDIIHYANKMYYMKTPILSDNEFDIIKEFVEKKYNTSILEIGAPVERNKVILPYEMASMDKIKPDTNALDIWIKKYPGPYVLSCKLDGVSAMYTTENGPKLYTRGNGKVGQDISHLIPYLGLPITKNLTIRGELVILKDDFEKYLKKYANPRNLVSGIINHKNIDENIKYVHFIAYEGIYPVLKPSDQMALLKKNIEVVLHEGKSVITNELLSELLVKWRKEYKYEIDGVIVTEDKIHKRKTGNPEHSFAFKMVLSDQIAEAKVVDVIWTPSKDGYLKPRVRIEPIHLGGVTIEYATGFNGSFIEKNKIGVGAVISIIRSGDVIPYIKGITVEAEAKMPSVPYKWNDTHVDVLLENMDDSVVKETNITGFFKGIHVEGLSSGNIHRIMEAGYDSIPKIIHMKETDFLKVDGFKEKLANKIYTGIQEQLIKASLVELMANSHIFGRGISEKKIEIILNELPNILNSSDTKSNKIIQVSTVKGMAIKSAESFVDRIDAFKDFLKEIGQEKKLFPTLNTNAIDSSNPLYQKNIVLTGLRDKDLMDQLKKVGANIASAVSKNTLLVIAKTKDTGKVLDANKLGIPIFTVEEFMNKYF
jgi:NAD-dependent DNA ligase